MACPIVAALMTSCDFMRRHNRLKLFPLLEQAEGLLLSVLEVIILSLLLFNSFQLGQILKAIVFYHGEDQGPVA